MRFSGVVLLVLLVSAVSAGRTARSQSYTIQAVELGGSCTVLFYGYGQTHREALTKAVVKSVPREIQGDGPLAQSQDHIVTIYAPDAATAQAALGATCKNVTVEHVRSASQTAEVTRIVDSGPPDNRIDVVMMGDGYTSEQRENWYSDVNRLVTEMFEDVTFASYLPLFNIWSVYQPSVESGIGVGGRPLNTAYGLYRSGTELRGVYTARPGEARAACRLTGPDACDYPTLIANSKYYGGLGGEFTIGTQSTTTGTLVLRHEMGHNYANVGEEYDGGQVYRGCNSARSAAEATSKWGVWATSDIKAEHSILRLQAYPWHDLDRSGPLTLKFDSDGSFQRYMMRMSVSGFEDATQGLEITLDGKRLETEAGYPGTLDRSFYTFMDMDDGFPPGPHELVFRATGSPRKKAGSNATDEQVVRQVCNCVVHEYKGEPAFNFSNSHYSAYPTWSINNAVTYRPTNELCLMRNMSSPILCDVCKEGIWHEFLKRMSLIDDVTWERSGNDWTVELVPVPVGQFRKVPVPGVEDRLEVTWVKDGRHVAELDGVFKFTRSNQNAVGSWRVDVRYVTSEVRSDPDNLLRFSESFTVE